MGVLREDPDLGPAHVAICRDSSGSARGYVIYSLRDAKIDVSEFFGEQHATTN
jgi:hypothetical protein